jgi:superfamily II DNA or RNA helicase
MAAKLKEIQLPPAHDWRTSDQDEINRRRLRAEQEPFTITNLDPRHAAFSNFRVKSPSGQTYDVEIRGGALGAASCNCVDFRSNGLGTCKHVEAVRLKLERHRPAKHELRRGSTRIDVVPDLTGDTLRLVAGADVSIPKIVAAHFTGNRVLKEGDPEEMVSKLTALAADSVPSLRVSQDVGPWIESRRRAAERHELRREYELKVQAGEWPAHETKVPLFPYQREGMLHLAFTGRALLADEMGLGKTIQAIAAAALLRRLDKVRRVLVVTPASLKAEWEEQIRRFTDLDCTLLFGSHHQRLQWYRKVAAGTVPVSCFTVANYEQVIPDLDELNDLFQPDLVILDEAQRIKNWNTRIARTVKRLRSRFAFILTGTPIENRIDELRSLVDFLDPALLGPLFRFNREFYALDERGRPSGYRNLDQLHARVKPVLLRRRKSQVETELPVRTDHHRFVPMTPKQKKAYATHEQEVMRLVTLAERRPLTDREQEKMQIELAMMRMICDTNFILDPADRECPKLEELSDILDDATANDAKVIVFSEWQRMLELVRDLCREKGWGFAWHTGSVPQQKRRADINRFKEDPECRVFLSTDAGATGLNLQQASVVVNCDLPWNPARLEQRIARAWRKHQTRPVTVYHLISENTLEHRMLETLATKRSVAESVLDLGGTVREIPLRSGRKAMVERMRELMQPASEEPLRVGASANGPETAPDAADLPPPALFAARARSALGGKLLRCEESWGGGRAGPVLCVVVEHADAGNRSQLETLHREVALAATGELPPLEILDRTTAEAIERLIAAGLLLRAEGMTRALYPLPVTAPLPLSEAERAEARAAHDAAAHALRRAQVLGGAGFVEETRASLLETAHHHLRAHAVEQRMPKSDTLADALQSPAAAGLGSALALVRAFTDSPTADWAPVAAALKAL